MRALPRTIVRCALATTCAMLALACGPTQQAKEPPLPPLPSVLPGPTSKNAPPPETPRPQRLLVKTRIDDVIDTYHGEQVHDPYRWLEDGTSKEVEAWTAAENARTRAFLDADPRREKLRARLDELLAIGFVGSPVVRTTPRKDAKGHRIKRYFHVKREGKMDQPVVFVREGADGEDRALLDPTTLGDVAEKTTALDWWYVSDDGERVAYGISTSGDELSTLHVRDVTTGKDLVDAIPRTRATYVSWTPDGKAFYYVRQPAIGSVPKDEESYHRKVYFHVLGTDPKSDPLIFGDQLAMTDWPAPMLSPSGKLLVMYVGHGPSRTSVYLKDLTKTGKGKDKGKGKDAPWVTLVDGPDAIFSPMPYSHGGPGGDERIFLRTNDGAPNFKLYAIDPKKPERANWKEIVAERPTQPFRDFDIAGGMLFLGYLDKASSVVERHLLDGTLVDAIGLPATSSASVPHGEHDGDEALFEVQSFLLPPSIHRLENIKPPSKGELAKAKSLGNLSMIGTPVEIFTEVKQTAVDTSLYEVQQIEATSKDGATVTAFVVAKKGLVKDGTAPTLLYGYGGFNLTQTPVFNRNVFAFLERGGVYVVSNLRGGAEYGEAWHRAGMLGQKQHTFDDQIAVAEKLIETKWTSKEKLAIQGGSNGGLLVAALETQRPDLFKAVICAVPLTDMLRYQRFLLAKLWVPEYGSSDDPTQYAWLRAYSPYHHVNDGTAYPATLVLTGASDSRVDPLHARKMAARLQAATSSNAPILLRVESKAGHGAGKPRGKQLEELADQYTFLFSQLGISL